MRHKPLGRTGLFVSELCLGTMTFGGSNRAAQLADNLAATRVSLSSEEWSALDEVSRPPAGYPGWMLGIQGEYRRKQLLVAGATVGGGA